MFLIINAILAQSCLKMSPSILFFIWTLFGLLHICPLLLPGEEQDVDFTRRSSSFFLISSSNLLSAGAAQQARSKNYLLFPFFFFTSRQKTNKQTKKKEKKKRCSVFSAGCCQRANQKAPPDGEQNSCRLQINVGCNSTAICPRPQLLTAAPPPTTKTPPSSCPKPHI